MAPSPPLPPFLRSVCQASLQIVSEIVKHDASMRKMVMAATERVLFSRSDNQDSEHAEVCVSLNPEMF